MTKADLKNRIAEMAGAGKEFSSGYSGELVSSFVDLASGAVIIRPNKDKKVFDSRDVSFGSELEGVLQLHLPKSSDYIFDFRGAEYLSSGALYRLVVFKKRLQELNPPGEMSVLPSKRVGEVFKISGLDEILNIVLEEGSPV